MGKASTSLKNKLDLETISDRRPIAVFQDPFSLLTMPSAASAL
jgi:hypothetical protein